MRLYYYHHLINLEVVLFFVGLLNNFRVHIEDNLGQCPIVLEVLEEFFFMFVSFFTLILVFDKIPLIISTKLNNISNIWVNIGSLC